MNKLESLQYFTPTGTSEGEKHILDQVFVEQENFDKLIIPKPLSPIVLVGKKGSGKSAILDAVSLIALQMDIPVARISPRSMKLVDGDDGSVASLTNVAFEALISAVVAGSVSELRGLVGGEDKILLDEGLKKGYLQRDLISRLSRILPRLAKPLIGGIDVPDDNESASLRRIKDVLRNRLARSSGTFYVLIDDTDQIADPGNSQHLNRIWGLILASRDLAGLSERLRVIVTVREEVWRRLSRSGAGQRDQADHFDKLVVWLTPSDELMCQIVERRLNAAARYIGSDNLGDVWSFFFKGNGAKMPTSDKFSSWLDLVVTRSRSRPRDAVQFLNSLAALANDRAVEKIEQQDLDAVVTGFSKKRVEFLRNEAEDECPDVEKVVDSLANINFDQGSFKVSFEVLREALWKLPSIGVTLFKRRLKPDDDDDFLLLLQFLFDYDILNARLSDDRQKDKYRFLRPNDDVTLISRGRWSDLQRIVWEVNPAFRDYLIMRQKDKMASRGLASKPKGRGRY
jgi:hypothetical protein